MYVLCVYAENTTCITHTSDSTWLLAVGTFIISLPTGCIVGVVTLSLCRLMLKKNAKKSKQTPPVYDYIDLHDKISVQGNKCYDAKTAPKLPQPREPCMDSQ